VGEWPLHALCAAGDVCAHPSLCQVQIWFWSASIAPHSCEQHWELYSHLPPRDFTYFYASGVSSHCSIDVFY